MRKKKSVEIFAKNFLLNKKIIKLGYGFTQDLRMITKSFGVSHEADVFRQSVLDLAYLVSQVGF